jgi:hypothetical protein
MANPNGGGSLEWARRVKDLFEKIEQAQLQLSQLQQELDQLHNNQVPEPATSVGKIVENSSRQPLNRETVMHAIHANPNGINRAGILSVLGIEVDSRGYKLLNPIIRAAEKGKQITRCRVTNGRGRACTGFRATA